MIPLVFLQVLEPFCPLSEQENLEPEDLEVNQPTCITSQTELNSSPLPSDSSSPNHKDRSCAASLTETEAEATPVPLTVVASPFLSDVESVPPPPLSDCTSASQPSSVSVPPLSNSLSNPHTTLSVKDDSCIPPQTQSDPPNSHHCLDVIAPSLSEILSDESNCTPIEDSLVKIVTTHSSLQKDENYSLQVPNSPSDSLA